MSNQKSYHSLRDEVFDYVRKKYIAEIEYPWMRYPGYAVFRHTDNQKWYGIVMDFPPQKTRSVRRRLCRCSQF